MNRAWKVFVECVYSVIMLCIFAAVGLFNLIFKPK